MWEIWLLIAIIVLVIYILRKNNEAGILVGWFGLAVVVIGMIISSDVLGILGCLVLLVSWYLAWNKLKREENASSSAQYAANSRKEFSKDIYKAIEEFGRLSYQCKQATQWAYDERDHALITVTDGPNGTKLEISCCGDCIACRLPSEFRWLYNEDNLNEIKYVAENVTGYVRENYGSVPSEADSLFYFFKRGNPRAVGRDLWTERNGDVVNMSFKLQ